MATKKITELPVAVTVATTDLLPMVDMVGPTTKSTTVALLQATVGAQGVADLVQVSNGSYGFVAATNVKAGTNYISVGPTTPAATGFVRLSNASFIASRNVGNTEDITIAELDASNQLFLGIDSATTVAKTAVNIYAYATTAVYLGTGGGQKFTIKLSTIESFLPITGGSGSPHGVHGESTIDMVDANYTAATVDYQSMIITNGAVTPMTAPRTLFLPNATDAACYFKFVRNVNGGANNLIVQDVAVGTTVTIADGFGAWVGIHAAGAFRMSGDIAA